MKTSATTVQGYLESLQPERRATISTVRDVVIANLPEGYEERVSWGMLSYEIPLERYPNTYNRQPLAFAALAAQKNHYALYLMCVYSDGDQAEWLKGEFAKAGKRMDVGKSCLRFKKVEDLPLDAIGEVISRITPERFIEQYELSRRG